MVNLGRAVKALELTIFNCKFYTNATLHFQQDVQQVEIHYEDLIQAICNLILTSSAFQI